LAFSLQETLSSAESGRSPACEQNGFHDLLIACAPAQVSGNGFPYFSLVRSWIALQKALGGEDHPWSTVPALDGSFVHKSCLKRMESLWGLNPFDGRDLFPIRLNGEHEAGVDRLAVNEHGAGAAISNETAGLGAGEPELFADHLKKRLIRLDRELERFVINRNVKRLFHSR
jgi:hypothetical protein